MAPEEGFKVDVAAPNLWVICARDEIRGDLAWGDQIMLYQSILKFRQAIFSGIELSHGKDIFQRLGGNILDPSFHNQPESLPGATKAEQSQLRL